VSVVVKKNFVCRPEKFW